jgi:hypothetical protein
MRFDRDPVNAVAHGSTRRDTHHDSRKNTG